MADPAAAESSALKIESIGIIRAGQMGAGIAHVCALAGYAVKISDVGKSQLTSALATIGRNLDRQVGSGRIDAKAKEAAHERITVGTDLAIFADCDVVIESATEFVRGDCNGDGVVVGTISDAQTFINYCFLALIESIPCDAACDANGDGSTCGSVNDIVWLLNFNFRSGLSPPQPYPVCGPGTEADLALGCQTSPLICE